MRTYTQILYHIGCGTKYREAILVKENRQELFNYIWGILKKKKCYLYRVNGVEDHIHLALDLHPTIALADLVKDIKLASSDFIKEKNLFPGFERWQDGYGAFTLSIHGKADLVQYIKDQEEHHRHKTYREELIELLTEYGVDFDEKYLD